MKAISLRKILCHHTGQFVCNITVGLKDLISLCIDFRQISLIPDDLCSCIRWLQRVAAKLKDLVFPNLFIEFFTDICGSCVHPDWGVRKYISIFIYCDRRPALSIDSDSFNLFRGNISFYEYPWDCIANCFPPFFRILFCPSRMWVINLIITGSGCLDGSVFCKDCNLAGTGSDIYS